MKPVLRSILLVAMLTNFAAAMTIDEYLAWPAEEKMKLLRGRPDRLLDDPRQLLRLYTSSLRDSSSEVRKAAAQASAFLVMGLQSAQGSKNLPAFSMDDSASFQQALVAALSQDDPSVRAAAASALANSAAPNSSIESVLLQRAKVEPVPEIKGSLLEAMAHAGYQSPCLIAEASGLLQSSRDSKALYSAAKVLADVRVNSALDTLIAVISNASPAQQHALRALAVYGREAARAIPILEKLTADPTMPDDIRILATATLQAIREEKPQPGNVQAIRPANLWPVAVSQSPSAPAIPAASPRP